MQDIDNGADNGAEMSFNRESLVYIEANRFFGFFQPHNIIDSHVEGLESKSQDQILEDFKSTWKDQANQIESATMAFVSEGITVVYGVEQGGKLPRSMGRDLAAVYRNPNEPRNSGVTIETISQDFEKLREKEDYSSLDSFAYIRFRLFKFMREKAGKDSDKVVGLLERKPKIYTPVKRFYDTIFSQDASINDKLNRYSQFVSSLVVRDLRFAGQILDRREEDPENTAFIIDRGTGHLGLVPALEALSKGSFPQVNLNNPVLVKQTGVENTLILPIVWSVKFWRELIEENNISLSNIRLNKFLETLQGKVGNKLKSSPWVDHLTSELESKELVRGKKVNLELVQNFFE